MTIKPEWIPVEHHRGGDTYVMEIVTDTHFVGWLYRVREWMGEEGANVAIIFVPVPS